MLHFVLELGDCKSNKTMITLLVVAVVAVVGVIAYGVLTMPDQRTTGQRIGDAVDELPNVDKAADKLGDRTPGQRIGDAVEDAGERIQRNTSN